MELEHSPTLPQAHQQIRLGDAQASAHKWSSAVECYLHALDHFQTIRDELHDEHLKSVIQVQIEHCEKTINLCRLKDRSEKATKAQQAERLSKLTRAHSISNVKESTKGNRMMARHNTLQLENTVMLGGGSPGRSPIVAKKNLKVEAHKIEELQMSYEALKTHLKVAFDDIERLKNENNELRVQKEATVVHSQSEPRSFILSHEEMDEDEPETELEATL